jgi:hypothetical protein
VGNEVGAEEEIEMKVGSEDRGMDNFEGLKGVALLYQRYACVWFNGYVKELGFGLYAVQETSVVV